jgi:hypothetical protein
MMTASSAYAAPLARTAGQDGDGFFSGLNAGGAVSGDRAGIYVARSMTDRPADHVRAVAFFDDGGYVTTQVLAYLDPGSGSMILQLLVGGVAAVGVGLKMYWQRVLSFLHIRRDDEEPVAEQQDATS